MKDPQTVEELKADREALIAILDQMLAPGAWGQQFALKVVPWSDRSVEVVTSVQAVEDVERWSTEFLRVVFGDDHQPAPRHYSTGT